MTAALRAGSEAELDHVVRDNPGLGVSSFRMARPEPAREFSGNWITCFWFQQDDSLVCNGVDCFQSATVRSEHVDEMAIGSSCECTNGCVVAPWTGFARPGGGGGAGEGEDPGEGRGGGGNPPDHQAPDGGPAGFLEGCEFLEPQGELAALDLTMIELIEWAAQQLPPWARDLLLDALADNRIEYWTNDIYRTTSSGLPAQMLADVHFTIAADPGGRLHLHLSAFSNLRHILCHEMAHWYFGIAGHPSALYSHAAACESYQPT